MKVFGKGSKERICFLTGRAKVHLKWYLAERTDNNNALFVTTKKPFNRITKNGVEYLLKEIAKRSGIPKLRLYPHKFRSTLATEFLNKGADISVVQHVLGHSGPQVTSQAYAKMEDNTLKLAHHKYVS
jgi:site-specific recombinase XerD